MWDANKTTNKKIKFIKGIKIRFRKKNRAIAREKECAFEGRNLTVYELQASVGYYKFEKLANSISIGIAKKVLCLI